MTATAFGIIVRRSGYQSSFKEEEKRTTLAALRMRKHRYIDLAQEELSHRARTTPKTPRLVPTTAEPLRGKFRGPGRHSIWDYMEAKVGRILQMSRSGRLDAEFKVAPEAAHRLMQILYTICDSTTVHPYISPDGENGISAVWYAEKYALELIVDCDGDAMAIVHVDGTIQSINLNKSDSAAMRSIRGHLGTLSVYVKSRNPNWRQLIAE